MEAQELVRRYKAGERDFSKVELLGANLSEADLSDVNLSGANLFRADLRGANLMEAVLGKADLRGAYLIGAKVTNEQIAQAKSLEGATMPDGTKHE